MLLLQTTSSTPSSYLGVFQPIFSIFTSSVLFFVTRLVSLDAHSDPTRFIHMTVLAVSLMWNSDDLSNF